MRVTIFEAELCGFQQKPAYVDRQWLWHWRGRQIALHPSESSTNTAVPDTVWFTHEVPISADSLTSSVSLEAITRVYCS